MKGLICQLALAGSMLMALSVPAAAQAWSPAWREPPQDRAAASCDDRGERDRRDRGGGWSRERHNGYYFQERWYYGPPPAAYFRDPGYEPGYTAWRRGAALPPFYRGYVISEPQRYRLRPPPRGFVWYRVGDAFLLTDMATGVIFEIVPY